jgi:uncharacterized membrane protein
MTKSPETRKGQLSERIAIACVWVLIAIFAIYFSTLALTKHRAFQTHGFDLGNYDQTVWNTSRGHLLVCTNWPPFGTSRLAYHVEPILLLIAPLYWLHGGPDTLLILQAVVVGLGAWPVAQIARRRLHTPWAGPLMAAIYLLFPALQTGPVFEFHAVTLAATFLAMALYAIEVEQRRAFALWAVLAAACKEEMSLLVAMMGLYLIAKKRRYVLGGVTSLLSVLWFLACVQVILSHFNLGGESAHLGRYSHLGDSPVDIVVNILRRPGVVVEMLRDPVRWGYLWRIPAPVGYLALLAPEVLVLALPTIVINVLSLYAPMYALDFLQYSVPVAPFVVIAAIHGSERLLRMTGRFLARYDRRFFLAVLSGYLLIISLYYQSFFGYTPVATTFSWPQITQHHRIGHEVLAEIPADAAVSAQMPLNSHLSQRRWVYVFPAIEDADLIALDVSSPRDIFFELTPSRVKAGEDAQDSGGGYSGDPSLTHTEYQRLVNDLLQGDEFGVVQARDGFLVLERGAPPAAMPEAFYSVFEHEGDVPGSPIEVRFGEARDLVGLALEQGPGEAYYLNTFWSASRPAGEGDVHVYLVLVDRSSDPERVVAEQELTASAFGSEPLWSPERTISDRVFVFFPREPEAYSLGVMVTEGKSTGAVSERAVISVMTGSQVARAQDDIRVLLLNPAGWEPEQR